MHQKRGVEEAEELAAAHGHTQRAQIPSGRVLGVPVGAAKSAAIGQLISVRCYIFNRLGAELRAD
jgi:hypothetical protein